ncbi:MAG: peptidylprolyl isomerase [Methylotenera sp.]|nr:peptidylprolyl isomerase [Methylotenera sp.]MDO9205010.1 peptidylprolyl isomerase [Methylotenera sp.]MDP2230122.1 peptidylprolyl isomerase [Methylotenera sp.]MDP3142250.1 peptidylprolyl isomerase [Methylotenera sp.]MDP3309265.1 peptidylprolyl isomerase [Methylotenera sp.]MDP3819442.1 peptidylprolyl isomerase [Methylotenera sp.]
MAGQFNAHAAGVVKLDRIVAVVDQTVITEQELESRIATVTAQLKKQGTELPEESILRKQILERLISDTLQIQYAAQIGLKVDDNQLDKTIERIAEQNQLSLTEFSEALAKDGISMRKFRADIRNEITIARLREREVDGRVNVSESEIDNYLTSQASRNENQDEFEISHILIRTPEEGATEDIQKAKAKVDKAVNELKSGTSFAKVSASFSDAPNALEGGNLGWKSGAQMPALFLDALKNMQSGEISPVLRSPNGFHILKLTNKRGGNSPLVIQQTHARHILIKLSEVMSDNEAKQKMDVIKERLDNNEKFEALARQYSEDSTASNGGDLGWVNPGDTVPQFEKAMNDLKDNQISQPVRSQFGWHIIQVIERRSQDMSKESARMKARQEIRGRKADEAYQDWIRELRDRAYVELRLEDKF